ncbi:MAG TPA: HEAT repeat domain-containing protein [Kofleriaceae bacterium]|nr:HEAT repeat domain-containing protein [Kofleriaceae bacterium]
MRRSGAVGIALIVGLIVVAMPRASRGDKVADSAAQLRSSGDYKIRLSAALHLAKQRGDARAVKALARALARDRESTVRRVAALSLGALVTPELPSRARRDALAALERASSRDRDSRVRKSASAALARARATLARARPARPRGGKLFLHVGMPSDLSRRLPGGSVSAVQAAVRGSLRRHAPDYAQSRGRPPTGSELRARGLRGYYVGAQVAKIAVQERGNQAEVRCTVSVRVSPWSGRDGHERLVASESASASGSGKISTSRSDARRAAVDCAVAVAEEITARQVVPFLRRVAAN